MSMTEREGKPEPASREAIATLTELAVELVSSQSVETLRLRLTHGLTEVSAQDLAALQEHFIDIVSSLLTNEGDRIAALVKHMETFEGGSHQTRCDAAAFRSVESALKVVRPIDWRDLAREHLPIDENDVVLLVGEDIEEASQLDPKSVEAASQKLLARLSRIDERYRQLALSYVVSLLTKAAHGRKRGRGATGALDVLAKMMAEAGIARTVETARSRIKRAPKTSGTHK
jgi:hypothetical protein